MKKEKIIFLIIIILLIIGIITSWVTYLGENNKIYRFVKEKINDFKNDGQKNNNQTNSLNQNSGGTNSETTSSGSSSGGTASSNCILEQITYSLEDLNKSFVCNQFDGELCINKTVFCQINVFNRDLSEEGNFEIEMAYFESGKSTEDALEIKSDTFYISANSIYLFKTFINLQNEFAEKDINCFANSKEIPKKQICQ